MTKPRCLFDANAIYRLIRDFPETAPDILGQGATSHLAYYELGNALWKESFLLKRISKEEAEKSLDFLYKILERMQVIALNSNMGSSVLDTAFKLKLTFYDSAYLAEANKTAKVLVTDDKKLTKAAENLGVKTLSSMAFMENYTE
jgi:predicted nucleic acid-binding protein